MNHGRLSTVNNQECLFPRVSRTTNFLERMRGLLFSPPLESGEALLIDPCHSIHTIGMRYAIDILFLDYNWKAVKIVYELKPWRSAACRQAKMVLELKAGSLRALHIRNGEELEWRDEIST